MESIVSGRSGYISCRTSWPIYSGIIHSDGNFKLSGQQGRTWALAYKVQSSSHVSEGHGSCSKAGSALPLRDLLIRLSSGPGPSGYAMITVLVMAHILLHRSPGPLQAVTCDPQE